MTKKPECSPGVRQTWFGSAVFQVVSMGESLSWGRGGRLTQRGGVDLPKATQHIRSGLRSRAQVLCESLPLSCPPPPPRPRHTLRQFSPGPAEPSVCRLDLDERVSLCRACRLVIVLKPCVGFSTPPVFYFFLRPQMVSLPPPSPPPAPSTASYTQQVFHERFPRE